MLALIQKSGGSLMTLRYAPAECSTSAAWQR